MFNSIESQLSSYQTTTKPAYYNYLTQNLPSTIQTDNKFSNSSLKLSSGTKQVKPSKLAELNSRIQNTYSRSRSKNKNRIFNPRLDHFQGYRDDIKSRVSQKSFKSYPSSAYQTPVFTNHDHKRGYIPTQPILMTNVGSKIVTQANSPLDLNIHQNMHYDRKHLQQNIKIQDKYKNYNQIRSLRSYNQESQRKTKKPEPISSQNFTDFDDERPNSQTSSFHSVKLNQQSSTKEEPKIEKLPERIINMTDKLDTQQKLIGIILIVLVLVMLGYQIIK